MTTERTAAAQLAHAYRGRLNPSGPDPRPAWAEPMFLADAPVGAMVALDVDTYGHALQPCYAVETHRIPFHDDTDRPTATLVAGRWFSDSRTVVVWHVTAGPPYITLDELDDPGHYLGPGYVDVITCAICDTPIGPLLMEDAEGYEQVQMVTPWLAYDVNAGTVALVCEDCAVTYEASA